MNKLPISYLSVLRPRSPNTVKHQLHHTSSPGEVAAFPNNINTYKKYIKKVGLARWKPLSYTFYHYNFILLIVFRVGLGEALSEIYCVQIREWVTILFRYSYFIKWNTVVAAWSDYVSILFVLFHYVQLHE